MNDDPDRNRAPSSEEDEAHTKEAMRVLEEYASQLREMIEKLRKRLN